MTVKSANMSTFAPRLSHVEDLTQWLKDNRGEGGPGTIDEDLWLSTMRYANETLTEEPWTEQTWYQSQGVSLHAVLFGLGGTRASFCMNRNLHEQLFVEGDARWSSSSLSSPSASLSSEVLGRPEDGFTAALRAQGYSLAEAIFENPSQIGGPHPTLIDKIARLQTQIDNLITRMDFQDAYVDRQIDRLDDRISGLS